MLLPVQLLRVGKNGSCASYVDVVYDIMERLKSGCTRPQQRRVFLVQLLHQRRERGDGGGGLWALGFNVRSIFPLEKVWQEATCKTCCSEGMMERPNFVIKNMPNKEVATEANKKSSSKLFPEKQTENRQIPQAGMVLSLDLWVALWKLAACWKAMARIH